MKRYHDIVGDGGSRILEQVAEQRTRITDGLAGVRHLVAVGSGKGGVGKSTLTLHLAGALRARGLRIAILDADFNGPSQARMAGVQGALFVPGSHKVALPRTRNGIAVFSMGSLIPESEALEFESAAHGESHTWRATREFALLGEILGSFEWGALDLLMFDLPPGAERTVQYADFLGPAHLVPARDDPFRGGTGRGRALGGSAVEGAQSHPRLRREHERLLLPRLQRHQAALCLTRTSSGPGDPLPRDRPIRSRARTALRSRDPSRGTARNTSWPGPGPCCAATSGQPRIDEHGGASPMKFLCVPCDSPMKLQTVGPPERGSLSVVYSCPECGYEMAMLTNAYETQVVQSLGVRIGPGTGEAASSASSTGCPFTAMIRPPMGRPRRRRPAGWRPGSRSPSGGRPPRKPGSRTFPSSSAPWREPASRDSRGREGPSKWTSRSSTRPKTSSACESIDR